VVSPFFSDLSEKVLFGNSCLPNDRLQSADFYFLVHRYRHSNGLSSCSFLHDAMASLLPSSYKSGQFQNLHYLITGKFAESRHMPLRCE
jgi:hypothetical protein